jgi:hypothetical protein
MTIKFNATGKQAFTDDYAVKAVKSFTGREGYGFECSLYKNGKRIGTVTDTASGGMIDFYLDKGEEEILDKYCASLPKKQWSEDTMLTKEQWDKFWKDGKKIDKDDFVTSLVTKWETQKEYKKWCRKKTVFRISDDKQGEFRTISQPFDSKIKAHLEKKYEGKGLRIINEEI